MSSHVGNLIHLKIGNYRLIQLLGSGSSSEVYVGEHNFLEMLVAVKVLHLRFSETALQRFLNEARSLAIHLDHPHITRLIDSGFDQEARKPFLVFNYAAGGNLRQRHPEGTRVSLVDIVYYVKQLASALQFAHNKNIIHGNIKPENMLVGQKNDIWLGDFGIATLMQARDEGGFERTFGTPPYMAPEQIQGHPCPASDQYALGIAVYEWLCGERPFYGKYAILCKKHLYDPPPSLRSWCPDISSDIEEVIRIALAKSPSARFANVEAFARALAQACGFSAPEKAELREPAIDTIETGPLPDPTPLFAIQPEHTFPLPDDEQDAAPEAPAVTHVMFAEEERKRASQARGCDIRSVVPESTNAPRALQSWQRQQIGAAAALARREQALPVAPAETSLRTKHGPSRRAILLSLGGVLALGGGMVAALAATHRISLPFLTGKTDAFTQAPTAVSQPEVTGGATPTPTSIPANIVLNTTQYVYKGHKDGVFDASWSPDGSRIASGAGTNEARASLDNTVQVWNAISGELLLTYKGHNKPVWSVAWSPDGAYIASGGAGRSLQVWDANTGTRIMLYDRHVRPIQAIAWSPDSKRVASGGSDNTVLLCTVTAFTNLPDEVNELLYEGHSGFVVDLSWSPDGSLLASASDDGTVRVWRASDGKTRQIYRGHADSVWAVAWSPDGTNIASGGGKTQDFSVQVWDPATGTRKAIYNGHSASVDAIAWSPDNQTIASASYDKTVHVWKASDGTLLGIYTHHSDQVWDVVWSPLGNLLASCGKDKTVQVWRPE